MDQEKALVDGLLRPDPERRHERAARSGRPLGGAVLLAAVGLAFASGVVAMMTYCTVQSVRNEIRVRQLESDVERLARQVESGVTSGLADGRDDGPYDEYGEYGEGLLEEDDAAVEDYGGRSLSVDDEDSDGAVLSRNKRRVKKNGKKGERKRKGKKNKLTEEKIYNYIQKKIKESAGLPAIHLNGALKQNASVMAKLQSSPKESQDYPALDGRLYQHGFVTNKEVMAFWEQTPWCKNEKTDKVFDFNPDEGSVTVKKAGIYFIYAQVYYRTAVEHLSFQIRVNGATEFTCKAPAPAGSPNFDGRSSDVTNSSYRATARGCYTAGLLRAEAGEKVTLWNRYFYPIVLEHAATFWGLIAIS